MPQDSEDLGNEWTSCLTEPVSRIQAEEMLWHDHDVSNRIGKRPWSVQGKRNDHKMTTAKEKAKAWP